MVVVWVLLAIGFLLFELHHLAFFALFVAAGCLAGAVTAVVAPDAYLAQSLAASAVAIGGVAFVRPSLRAAYVRHHHQAHVVRGVHGGLVGQEAITLDDVGDEHGVGHVRLVGERWLAVTGSGATIPAGTRVVVTEVRGTTLVVWPVDMSHPKALDPTSEPDRS